MNKEKTSGDWLEKTEQYYSCLLGARDNLFASEYSNPYFFYSQIRNAPMEGYEMCFDLLASQTEKGIVISYGDAAQNKISELKRHLESDAISLSEAIFETYDKQPLHSLQYYFAGDVPNATAARVLNASDYEAFESFFLKCNAGLEDVSWLPEYFDEMISEELCCGVFVDDFLVSCTDAPAVPFMKDEVREIGINTLKEYRNQGFAKDVCSCAIQMIIKQMKCPVWTTNAANVASQKLAESLGFKLFGETFAISLDKENEHDLEEI